MSNRICTDEFGDWENSFKRWAGAFSDCGEADVELGFAGGILAFGCAVGGPACFIAMANWANAIRKAHLACERAKDNHQELMEQFRKLRNCLNDHKKLPNAPVVTPLPIVTPLEE